VSIAEGAGFKFVDVRMTLEREGAAAEIDDRMPIGQNVSIRAFHTQDLALLQEIARGAHTDSRFYFDRNFPHSVCNRLYETWITASCQGTAEHVLVAELQERAIGYATCQLDAPGGSGRIGLFGLSADVRGRGIGTLLLQHALAWFEAQGAHRVFVVTQGRNVAAQALYQRRHFVTSRVELWFHKWFELDLSE
jgi:GNAT superfamily N-acetyltransferase